MAVGLKVHTDVKVLRKMVQMLHARLRARNRYASNLFQVRR